jgi:hypothetical protein
MLTFAISLLFTAGAAFAVLVIVGMLVGNGAAIVSALAGHGAFAATQAGSAGAPLDARAQVKVGPVRRGIGQALGQRRRAVTRAGLLRVAA